MKENLLVLKYYSYETHLITDTTIKSLLEQLTKIPGSLITHEVVDWIKQDFESQLNELYYFSLEALKKMCDNSYQADITYGLDGGAVIGKSKQYKWSLIETKTSDLDQFAIVHGISKSDLKYIAKGKWLLATWCDYLIKKQKFYILYAEYKYLNVNTVKLDKPINVYGKKVAVFRLLKSKVCFIHNNLLI